MRGIGRPLSIALLAAAGLLVATAAAASALDVSTKAIKVVGSEEYTEDNVQAYAGELAEVGALDGRDGAIAVLDTGVDDEHPAFENAFVGGAIYSDDCACMRDTDLVTGERINPDDRDGHGTHVASIALGHDTEDGARGVAPAAKLVDVKIASDVGGASSSRIAEGIEWVLDYNAGETNWTANTPVKAIVVAYGSLDPQEERTYEDNPAMQAIQKAYENGVLTIAAAGNCGPDNGDVSSSCPNGGDDEDTIASPGATPEAITVGAVDDNNAPRRAQHNVTGFSSRGPNPAQNASDVTWRKPDVVAPGANITAACWSTTGDAEGSECTLSGTSMAAPHVAGLALIVHQALNQASDTDPSPEAIKQIITETAEDRGKEGWDRAHGYGYVDGYEAVVEATNTPPDSSFTVVPAEPEAGEQVTLDASESADPDERDEIDRYRWTIDGNRTDRAADEPRLQHTFHATGEHTIELATVDTRGTADPDPARKTITVTEPTADESDQDTQDPQIEIAVHPQGPTIDEQVRFDASNTSDPDGHELVGFAWDVDPSEGFDPDRQTESPTTTWTFEEAGEHAVRVEVTDANGDSSRTTFTVDVAEPQPDPPRIEITNPQEGDVVETGPLNVTWIVHQGPVDSFGVTVDDETAVGQTEQRYLEVALAEDDRSISVKAQGPGGEAIERVNITVVEEEDVDQQSTEDEQSEEQPDPNPTRAASSDDATDEADGEAATTNASTQASEDDENETPAPALATLLATALGAARVGARRS